MSIEDAFHMAVKDAQEVSHNDRLYVSRYQRAQGYGGPEEGGWWRDIITLQSYKRCNTQEEAERVCEEVKALAEDLTKNARRAHGEACLREVEQAERAGWDDIDAFYGGPGDGPDTYFVVTEVTPGDHNHADSAHWE